MRLPPMVAAYRNGAAASAISAGYALAVLGVAVFVVLARGLSGVWLVVLTLPSSLLAQFVPADGTAFILCLTAGGLAQAWLLWLLLRGKRQPGRRSG